MKWVSIVLVIILGSKLCGQWEANKRLTVYPTYYDFGSFNNARTIAVRDTNVHIVWEHMYRYGSGEGELYYVRSVNSGESFEPDTQLTIRHSHYPSVAVQDSVIHIVWHDFRNGYGEIYYKRSMDNGNNWGADIRVTNDNGSSKYPSIAVQGSIIHIVWEEGRDGNDEIYYKQSMNNGTNWGADTRITNNSSYSDYPSIAVWDSVIHIVWMDRRDGNYEIYYKRSTDNGMFWDADERLTNTVTDSRYSSVACWNSHYDVHTVWTDEQDGNQEIYYKRHKRETGIEESKIDIGIRVKSSIAGIGGVKFAIYSSLNSLVELKVFNIMGRIIDTRELTLSKGDNNFDWYNDKGGVYFFRFKIRDVENPVGNPAASGAAGGAASGKELLSKGIIF
ncbi:MAG: hypothetical protein HY769_02285 [Candidatus Stahlbacteria bacterium]|nr:hypothetical protein [Candidatus Stahlbacteria bacterium]